MKRTPEQILGDEAQNVLICALPLNWNKRVINPDNGIDLALEIVDENGEITPKILWLQVKGTEKIYSNKNAIVKRMETKHLKYYENSRTPVVIVLGIKNKDRDFDFYYCFAQKYIKEELSQVKPDWRSQESVTIDINNRLNPDELDEIASNGYFYVTLQRLNISPEKAYYLVDGIIKSDDMKFKEESLEALYDSLEEKHAIALDKWDRILKMYTLSPTQKISIYQNIGNSFASICKYDKALEYYRTILDIYETQGEKGKLEGHSAALGGIGIILCNKGYFKDALMYQIKALEINRMIGHKQGEFCNLNNIGNIYHEMSELDNSLKYYHDAHDVAIKMGYAIGEGASLSNIASIYVQLYDFEKAINLLKEADLINIKLNNMLGEAMILGTIGGIFFKKEDYSQALIYLQQSKEILQKIDYKKEMAVCLKNIGLIFSEMMDYEKALDHFQESLKINQEIGHQIGISDDLGRIGTIYLKRCEYMDALEIFQKALKIDQALNNKYGEGDILCNIGVTYQKLGDYIKAIDYLTRALEINNQIGDPEQLVMTLFNIGLVYRKQNNLPQAIKYFTDAHDTCVKFNVTYQLEEINEFIDSTLIDYYSKKGYTT